MRGMLDAPGSFRALVSRSADPEDRGEPDATEASLAAVLAGGEDPGGIVGYLRSLGLSVSTLDDLLLVNSLGDEEELSAHAVSEGIAIGISSQGSWVLFRA